MKNNNLSLDTGSSVLISAFLLVFFVLLASNYFTAIVAWMILLPFISLVVMSVKNKVFLFVVLFTVVVFQNFILSIFSPLIQNTVLFKSILGLNFFFPLLLFCIYYILNFRHENAFRFKLYSSSNFKFEIITILLMIGYFGVKGGLQYGWLNMLMSMRIFLIGLLYFFIGYSLLYKLKVEKVNSFIYSVVFIITMFIFFEELFPHHFYKIINGDTFKILKFSLPSDVLITDLFRERAFLNLPFFKELGFFTIRSEFPFIHPISLAYFLFFYVVYFAYTNNLFLSILSSFFILLFPSSKGAFVLAFVFLLIIFFEKLFKRKASIYRVVLFSLPFVLFQLVIGLKTNNEHVIGFFGGLSQIYEHPFGQGFGVAGNFSSHESIDSEIYIEQFKSGKESAFGVLFSSMGLFGLLYVIFFFRIFKKLDTLLKKSNRARYFLVAAVLVFIFGIFQEESFSAYGFGLCMMFSGIFYKKTLVHEFIKNH